MSADRVVVAVAFAAALVLVLGLSRDEARTTPNAAPRPVLAARSM